MTMNPNLAPKLAKNEDKRLKLALQCTNVPVIKLINNAPKTILRKGVKREKPNRTNFSSRDTTCFNVQQ